MGVFKNDIVGLGLSPGCSVVLFQSIEFILSLGGVPVFNLPVFRSKSDKKLARFFEECSPTLPPSEDSSPVNNLPLRKVPAVRITLLEWTFSSFSKTTPETSESLIKSSLTSDSTIVSKCSLLIILFTELE